MTRAMKDSGIEWIGEIPKDWGYVPLKAYYEFEKGKNAALYTQEYIGENEGPYPVYSGQTQNEGIMGRVNSYDYDIKKCLFTTTVGAKVMTPKILTGRFCLSQNCLIMKQIQQVYDNFIYYLLIPLFDYYKSLIPTYMQPSLRIEDLKSYRFYLPSIPEQQKIADFLYEKCSHIDSVLEKVRASIDEYKQLKQSVITQAVTKGIRPNRPMKDSGIEWIGEIPQDWEIRKIKSLGQYRNGLTYAPEDMCEESNGTLVLRSSNVKQGKISYDDNIYVSTTIPKQLYVRKGDILVCSRNGSRELIGKNAIIKDNIVASFGAFMMIYRCDTPEYVYYILNSHVFNYYLGSFLTSTINQLTGKNFGNMSVVYCPNKTEQTEIASYLDDKCSKIDKLITKKEQLIAELETYKKSLIYEYVTGKKEVK